MKMKIHSEKGGVVVALCDKELLGRVFKEGEVTLNLKDYREFYDGETASEPAVLKQLKNASSANLVGEKSVALAIKRGFGRKEDVRTVQGVPHLQVYRILRD